MSLGYIAAHVVWLHRSELGFRSKVPPSSAGHMHRDWRTERGQFSSVVERCSIAISEEQSSRLGLIARQHGRGEEYVKRVDVEKKLC